MDNVRSGVRPGDSFTSLKELKEAFVSGHDGTTPLELILLCSSAPIGYLLQSCVLCCLTKGQQTSDDKKSSGWVMLLLQSIGPLRLEALAYWIPMILCQSDWLYPIGVFYLLAEVLVWMVLEQMFFADAPVRNKSSPQLLRPSCAPDTTEYMTSYRSCLLYLTFVAILAVDFPFFPRRFAKTETTGYSLMDLGAASFAFSAGLVASKSHRRRPTPAASGRRWTKAVKLGAVLLLGSLRFLTHQELDYQEHVSEYGVHWNFFYTLAILMVVPRNAHKGISLYTFGLAVLLVTIYQVALSRFGVQDWIENSPRRYQTDDESRDAFFHLWNLFAANREGVLGSIFGYLPLYWIAEYMGAQCLWVSVAAQTDSTTVTGQPPEKQGEPMAFSLWTTWFLSLSVWLVLTQVAEVPLSRRSTNAAFLSWVLVVNLPLLGLFRIIEQRRRSCFGRRPKPTISSDSANSHTFHVSTVSVVTHALNQHGLLCFVIANLLTGLVNLSINTLEVQNLTAFAILVGYMTAVGVVALALEFVHSFATGPHHWNQTKVSTEKVD